LLPLLNLGMVIQRKILFQQTGNTISISHHSWLLRILTLNLEQLWAVYWLCLNLRKIARVSFTLGRPTRLWSLLSQNLICTHDDLYVSHETSQNHQSANVAISKRNAIHFVYNHLLQFIQIFLIRIILMLSAEQCVIQGRLQWLHYKVMLEKNTWWIKFITGVL